MSAQHTPKAMLAAFKRIPLGQPQDKRKLKRWINTVWNRSHALERAREFPNSSKATHTHKMSTLRAAVRMYKRAARATGSTS